MKDVSFSFGFEVRSPWKRVPRQGMEIDRDGQRKLPKMTNENQSARSSSMSDAVRCCQAIEAMDHGSPLGITMITHFKAKNQSKGEPPAKMAKVSKD